ncbi:PIG-L family deacetylase [Candidatus Curtissbacteria bacterium]|nr:PIG-L family deacetylase [Candidatus Curtissbacteria bacterium]
MLSLTAQKLLIIAPHPDDEVIGCGGLIKRIKDSGGKVYVLYLTVGDTRDFTKKGLSTGDEREKEIEAVVKYLKIDGWDLAFAGNDYHLQLDKLGQKALMDVIERDSKVSIENIKPTIVAIPCAGSYNQDHKIAAPAAFATLRPTPTSSKHFVETILEYEEPADNWSFKASNLNFFVALFREELDAKLVALKLYKSQLREAPHMRSAEIIRALAKLRGAQIGSNFAEAFKLYRAVF